MVENETNTPVENKDQQKNISKLFTFSDLKKDVKLDENTIAKVLNNMELMNKLKLEFYQIAMVRLKVLVTLIIKRFPTIHMSNIGYDRSLIRSNTFFYQNHNRNPRKIDDAGMVVPEVIQNITNHVVEYLNKMDNIDITRIDKKGRQIDNIKLNKNMTYDEIIDQFEEAEDYIEMTYDFEKPDLQPISELSVVGTGSMFRTTIGLTQSITFSYPLLYNFRCEYCNQNLAYTKKYSNLISHDFKIKCTGVIVSNTGKPKTCSAVLKPVEDSSKFLDAYYYLTHYKDEEGKQTPIYAWSFKKLEANSYDVVAIMKSKAHETPFLFIVDARPLGNIKKYELPPMENAVASNYLFTILFSLDKYIKQQTGFVVQGLFPIKMSMLLQFINSFYNDILDMNIMFIGAPGIGKSIIMQYWLYMLYKTQHHRTQGNDVSIPGLRGTIEKHRLFAKEISYQNPGLLGLYKIISIDEANQNKELVENLKTYLYETNYMYSKAYSTKMMMTRTAHVNVSENILKEHLVSMRLDIKKAYKNMDEEIEGAGQKPNWDESWDLTKPLQAYFDNPYLHEVIKDWRLKKELSNTYWLDGYDLALHERFPFYFYLVKEKEYKLSNALNDYNPIRDNTMLMSVFDVDNLSKFIMEKIKTTKDSKKINYIELQDKTEEIMKEYGVQFNTNRLKITYSKIVLFSCLMNDRTEPNNLDYDLLRYILENTNQRVDAADTFKIKINGPPNQEEIKKKSINIENASVNPLAKFNMPGSDFD